MNARILKSVVFGLLLSAAFVVSACGTLEIEQESATGMAEEAATATAMPLPTATAMPLPTATAMPAPTLEVTPTSISDEAQAEEVVRASEIVSLDETWNQYTDYRAGFSIKFPKMMMAFNGSCIWNEEPESYRYEMALVPVSIFEDTDAVYIAGEYLYALAGEREEATDDGGTRYFYDECNQMTNSLELLRDPENFHQQMWKLVVAEIRDEDDLDSFIKSRYGSGCSLGEQVASNQDGVYDVRIQGDGKSLEETQCPLNFGTVVKYYSKGNKVIAWDTGQAYTFPADKTNSVTHDQEMIESFSFITDAAIAPVTPAEAEVHEEEVVTDSEIISLDETWNQFTDNRLGFTIKFPKTMATFRGSCTWNEEQGSYRPQMALVPVKVFEDSDAVYIAPEHYFELAGERIDDNIHYYDECNHISNSLELLRDPENEFKEPFWKLVVVEIHDDGELDGFIKARYGSGCSLGEQVASGQDGVYDVKVHCPLNYSTVVKYFPTGNSVIAWDRGQSYYFPADVNYTVTHDDEMADSFAFITEQADHQLGLHSYTNDDFGFTFQYPADWALEVIPRTALDEGPGMPQWLADAVVLSKGKLALAIQHIRMSESVAWDGRHGGGPYDEAIYGNQVTLIGQDTNKMVWTYNDGIKAIEVQAVSQDADLALQIALRDGSVEWIGDPAAETVPETAIGVLDQILSSFALTQ